MPQSSATYWMGWPPLPQSERDSHFPFQNARGWFSPTLCEGAGHLPLKVKGMATLLHAQGMVTLLFKREGDKHPPWKWKGLPSPFSVGEP